MNTTPVRPEPVRAPSASPAPIRIVVIGGYALTRDGLRALIGQHEGMRLIADAESFNGSFSGPAPDVVVLDLDGAHPDVLSLLHETRETWPHAHVIVLSARSDPARAEEFVLAGASGVLTKDRPAAHLANAIRKVYEGEVWLGRAPMAHLIAELAWKSSEPDNPETARIQSLTMRERDVVKLVAAGLSNKAIASKLQISDNTVRHHLTSVFAKLEVPDRLALAVYALRHRIAEHPA